jgi:hypothetical protein
MCQVKLSGEMVRVRKRKCFFSKFYCECDAGMSGIVIGKKTNGTGRDGTGLNGIERDGVKL